MIVDPVERERRVDQELYRLQVQRAAKRLIDAEERGPVQDPEILTRRERLARPRIEPQFRIDRWQPKHSRIMFPAPHKGGKPRLLRQ